MTESLLTVPHEGERKIWREIVGANARQSATSLELVVCLQGLGCVNVIRMMAVLICLENSHRNGARYAPGCSVVDHSVRRLTYFGA